MTGQHGGRREGAGRKPRKDGRKLRLVKIALNDKETVRVLSWSTDERRVRLLGVNERDDNA
jgi:hypothetical protein